MTAIPDWEKIRVEEILELFKEHFHMTASTKADHEAEKRLFDPLRESLNNLLTQSRLQDRQELEWRVIGLAPYDEKNDENLISRKDVIALLKD